MPIEQGLCQQRNLLILIRNIRFKDVVLQFSAQSKCINTFMGTNTVHVGAFVEEISEDGKFLALLEGTIPEKV